MYLDHNATTPLDPRVAERMRPFFAELFGNPASREHAYGWAAAEAVEAARDQVAELVGATPVEIVFTSGTTESVNLAIKGLASQAAAIVTAATEHNAVLEVCRQLARTHGAHIEYVGVDRDGRLELTTVVAAVQASRPCLAVFALANAETGVIHNLSALAAATHAAGGLLCADLAQAVGKISVDVRALGVDVAAFSAHKMYGPKGVGALFVRDGESGVKLEPLIVGGGQERSLRGGTLNVPAIVGFGKACRIARAELADEAQRVAALRDRLESYLLTAVQGVAVNGDRESRLPNTSNLRFLGIDARALIRDLHNVAVSTQSACSTGSSRPSHVLTAMGLTDDEAYGSIRFSLGRSTTQAEIDAVIAKVIASVARLRSA